MTFCGYHPDMESGIEQFGRGLVAAIRKRCERTGLSMEDVAMLEQQEMNALCEALLLETGGPRKVALEGLANFVRGIFLAAGNRIRAGEDVAFDIAIEEEVRAVGSLIKPMENESQALSASRESQAMQKLARWVSRRE